MPDAPFREPLLAGSTTFHPPTADVPSARLVPVPGAFAKAAGGAAQGGRHGSGMGRALRGGYGARVAGRTRPQVGELLQVTAALGRGNYMRVDRGRGRRRPFGLLAFGANCRTVPKCA